MPIEPLRFKKNWHRRTGLDERNFDEIADNTAAWSLRVDSNLKQLGLDINGASYDFNNVGRATQATSVVARLDAIEAAAAITGTRNLGLDVSTVSKIKVWGATGVTLSPTNKGYAIFNSSANGGQLVTRELTANLEVTLTGAHWGNDTYGDLTDYILWIALVDNGTSTPVLAVTAQGGRDTITAANAFTTPGSITSKAHWLCSSAVSSTYNVIYMGYILADFDDTGNAGGENFWTIQTGLGDVHIGRHQTTFEGTVIF